MTAVIGLKHKGDVWLGGDSAGSSGHYLSIRREPKVFQRGEIGIGYCGSFRMGNLLRHRLQVPAITPGVDLHWWASVPFIDAVRKCLTEGGWLKKLNEVQEAEHAGFLLAVRGRLFEIQSDLQVGERREAYDVVGCGHDLALGAMHQIPKSLTPGVRIRRALQTAAKFSAWVAPPFRIIKIPRRSTR